MARQICQGGPRDTRLGAVLGDTQLSPGISSRCHLSDDSTANGIVSLSGAVATPSLALVPYSLFLAAVESTYMPPCCW
ncbi:hypothetical protein VZT92_018036 [Zoarces viviparus]|uniref:Uncharacterized protein n=1 Tax=Zoarces viviparus TaxID=48416 RepID=A0AAW1EQI1_ZOAVI